MKPINIVIESGNLGKDPETKYTPDGTMITSFPLGTHVRRKVGDEYVDETDWYDVTVWGQQGEWVMNSLTKGSAVIVNGRLRQSKWVDQQTNQRRVRVEIVANDIHLLPGRDAPAAEQPQDSHSGEQGPETDQDVTPQRSAPPVASQPKVTPMPQRSIPRRPIAPPPDGDDDMPF